MSDKNSRLSIRLTAAEKSRYWRLRRGLEIAPDEVVDAEEVFWMVDALEVR